MMKGPIKNDHIPSQKHTALIAGRSCCVHFLSEPLSNHRIGLDKKRINRQGAKYTSQETNPISAGEVAGQGENFIAPEGLDGYLKEQDDE